MKPKTKGEVTEGSNANWKSPSIGKFKELREEGLMIVRNIRKTKLPDMDLHDALWLHWKDYFQDRKREIAILRNQRDNSKIRIQGLEKEVMREKASTDTFRQEIKELKEYADEYIHRHREEAVQADRKELIKKIEKVTEGHDLTARSNKTSRNEVWISKYKLLEFLKSISKEGE
jgi:hypothetical protein